MSVYMNYENAGNFYDDARLPAGVDVMSKMLTAFTGKPLSDIELLDAGCGTGNYSVGFLNNGVKHVTMVDASSTMLEKAKKKTQPFEASTKIHSMTLPNLDFSDESFDAVSIIQVLHHIDTHALKSDKEVLVKTDYPNLIATLGQAFRVLRPGGVLLLDTMFEENIESFWWTSLCPLAAGTMKRTRIKRADLFEVLEEIGFANITYMMQPNSCLVKREIYDQIERIGDPLWRGYLSQYRLVENSGELDQLIRTVQEKVEDGLLPKFSHQWNEKLRTHGNHVTVYAQKLVTNQ